MKSTKLKVLAIMAGVVLACCLFDFCIAQTYKVEVVSVSNKTPVADGATPVELVVKVTFNGNPCVNHLLLSIVTGGGSFRDRRVMTDENGTARIVYYPYLANAYVEAKPVDIQVSDLSNSILISVPAKAKYTLRLTEPGTGSSSNQTNEGMFG